MADMLQAFLVVSGTRGLHNECSGFSAWCGDALRYVKNMYAAMMACYSLLSACHFRVPGSRILVFWWQAACASREAKRELSVFCLTYHYVMRSIRLWNTKRVRLLEVVRTPVPWILQKQKEGICLLLSVVTAGSTSTSAPGPNRCRTNAPVSAEQMTHRLRRIYACYSRTDNMSPIPICICSMSDIPRLDAT